MEIIAKRIKALGQKIAPIGIAMGPFDLAVSINGWVILLIFAILVYQQRSNRQTKVILLIQIAALSISLSNILVTSAAGATYISVYHYLAMAFIITSAANLIHYELAP